MDKDKILKFARTNKHRGKEFENKEAVRSSLLGSAISILLGIGLFLLEYLIKGSINVGLIAVGMTAASVQWLYEGIKVKKAFLIITGAFTAIIALLFILLFVGQVVAV